MEKRKCRNYFESYIRHLTGYNINVKKLRMSKKHILTCKECQDDFLMFVDIIEEHLFESTLESTLSFKDANILFNNFYNIYADNTTANITKYLLVYKKYRNKVLDILRFKSTIELYDFYATKILPAFDEQLHEYKAS